MPDIDPLFQPPAETEQTGFTRWDLLALLCKHWFAVLVPFVVVSVLVGEVLLSLPSTYVTTAKVLVRTESQGRPSLLSGVTAYREPLDTDTSDRKIETEMALLLSRPIAEDTVRALNIRFDDLYRPVYEHVLDFVSDAVDEILARWFGLPVRPDTQFNRAVRAFMTSVTVSAGKSKSGEAGPNVIDVELKAASPDLAQRALVRILDRYVTFGTRLDQDAGQAALAIVQANLAESEKLVEAAQARLNAFLARTGRTLTAAPPVAVAKAMPGSAVPSGDSVAEAYPTDYLPGGAVEPPKRVQRTPSDGGIAGDGAPMSDSTVPALRSRLMDLEFQRSEMEQVFTDRAENVRNVQALITEVRLKLKTAIRKSADDDTTLIELHRQLTNEEARLLDLKRKNDQIALFLAMNPTQTTNRVVVEVPLLPDRSDWKKKAVPGVLSAIAGLLLGLAIAGFRELGDHTLRDAADARRYLGVESLGSQWKLERREVERALATSVTAKS
jgi:uncharacterized protein involved in exopolysaccharide biosynthesis